MVDNNKIARTADSLIFVFIVIFLLTLHNSIFLNQIGYYGALLLMLIRGALLRKNPFKKTGLEWYFFLFILAELISAILSYNHSNAFENVLKRILLIPIVYVIYTAADTKEKAVIFFKIYISAAVITVTLYIIFAYEHFINQLYQLEARGPSPFQYVMTAGGLISFSVIFLFAFLVNEKSDWKKRLLILGAFLLSLIALGASYTRAAWIGAAAGIFVILVLKRKWIIIIPLIVLFFALLLTQRNTSLFILQNANDGSIIKEIEYPGKIYSVFHDGDEIYFSAYDEGVLQSDPKGLIPVIKTEAPVIFFSKWKKNIFFSFLIDQRFEIYQKNSGKFEKINELISPGFSTNYFLSDDILYVSNQDSGLTIFPDPLNPQNIYRYPEFGKVLRLAVSSDYIASFDFDGVFQIVKLKKGFPSVKIFSRNVKSKFGFTTIIANQILFATENQVELLTIENDSVVSSDVNKGLKNINSISLSHEKLFASGFLNKIFELKYPIGGRLEIIKKYEIPFIPTFFDFQDDKFYYTNLKINRVNSIWDPYHYTNIERLNQWKAGIAILRDHPLFGVGDIDMKEIYMKYRSYYEKETYGHLHNNYIQLLVALGLFGFIIVMGLLVKILSIHFRISKALTNLKFASSYALGASGTFVGFLVSGLGEWNFGDHEIITMIWFILGLNLAFYKTFHQVKQENIIA